MLKILLLILLVAIIYFPVHVGLILSFVVGYHSADLGPLFISI